MTKNTPPSSHSHLHILTFLLFTLPFHGNTQNNQQEQTILLRLKQHWSNPPSLSHWTSSLSDHCTMWPEITCTNGSITKLKIIDQNITGTIPPFICDLNNLTYIDLHYNYIPGTFPTVLYNCSKLEYLDLSQNYFVGTIPDDIDRLSPRLQYLNLEANNFTGDIPSSIGSFPSLTSLHLTSNLFNGSFPPEIGNLSNLEELVLSRNGFSPQSIPSSFTQLKKLKNFWMTEANLIGEIPDSIGNMSALEYLDLSVNGMSGRIPNGIFFLNNLTHLYLYKNRFSGSIPQTVEALNLQILDLSSNTLIGTIPDDFGKLTKLTGLALFSNQLSGEVPVNIGRLPGLVDVGLYSNNLSGELPPDFGRYSMLKTFQVSSNRFVGVLPAYLCDNKKFIGLIAFENNLTGGLPDSLGDCNSLEIVRVHDNHLSGKIPDGLWTSLNLTTLMISQNLFSGELPERIGSRLSLIELMNNKFSGRIPASISSWEKLTVFRASNNLLSGEVPQELTALPMLATILLDGNQLSGRLPLNIISWKSLTTLNLSRNQLSGEIPASFCLLPDLLYLDLSRNDFSGRIPPEFNILRLSSLNLSYNRFYGGIPSEYENAAFDSSFLNNPGLCSNNPSLLGLSSCRPSQTRKSHELSSQFIAAVSSIAAIALLVSILYTIYVFKRYRKQKHVAGSTWKLTPFQRLNFTEANILSSLKEECVIGSGGSGKVYCAPISRSGEYVAVKRIWDKVKLDERQFLAEVRILGTIRHSNIVKLICCISGENLKLLVYEYMQNQSLDRWLHGKKRAAFGVSGLIHHAVLEWPKRLHIAIGAAQGLCYMHHHCSPRIIHCDVKSSNILLDSVFNAKIADFGLARMLVENGETNTMSVVAGSFGYMAPEYAQTRRVNAKIDVYSFGVVLLELVTGREANYGDEHSSLADWARRHIQEGKPIVDVLDEDINEPHYMEEITTVLKLGLMCTNKFPSSRPAMNDVLQILLRCGQHLPLIGENTKKHEYDVAPLLRSSKPERTLESEDSVFSSTSS